MTLVVIARMLLSLSKYEAIQKLFIFAAQILHQ